MQDTMTQKPVPASVVALRRAEALTPIDLATVVFALCLTATGPVLQVLDELDALEAARQRSEQ